MKALIRIDPRVVGVLSGMGCLLVVAWWGASYWGRIGAIGSFGGARYEVWGDSGRVVVVRFRSWEAETPLEFFWESRPVMPARVPTSQPLGVGWTASVYAARAGFEYGRGTYEGPSWWWQRKVGFVRLGVPHVLIVVLLGVLPAGVVRRWRQRRGWWEAGRCVGCGYDLRGTPRRCPECGRTPGDMGW